MTLLTICSDSKSEFQKLFSTTKRKVLQVIRIQTGPTLMDILARPVTQWEEDQFNRMVVSEREKENSKKIASNQWRLSTHQG